MARTPGLTDGAKGNLAGYEDRLPSELSGGQQQRVALARAMAPRPEVILLDEPFSNLDASLRDRVRNDLRQILIEAGATAVFVTHNVFEAVFLSERVLVMSRRPGRVVAEVPVPLSCISPSCR